MTTDLQPLDASKLSVTQTTTPRHVPDIHSAEAASGAHCTDHMLLAHWSAASGWAAPTIVPYGPISFMPTASVLHYATTCFEGMKLYRGADGGLRLFRPELNAARLRRSSERIALPTFDAEAFVEILAALCRLDGDKWLPPALGEGLLYVRPTMWADSTSISVKAPTSATLCIMLCFLPPASPTRPPATLLGSPEDSIRAWPGGFGHAKVGANYGPGLVALADAHKKGHNFVLWLLERSSGVVEVTEAGSSNFMVVIEPRGGGKTQLITPRLHDQVILDGITRRSTLELARARLGNELEVVEKVLDITEILEAEQEGRLVEAFAVGTAVFVWPLSLIHYRGKDVKIPVSEGNTGKYAQLIRKWLEDVMYGRVKDDWAMVL